MSRTVDFSIVIPVYYNEGALTSTFDGIRREVLDTHPELRGEVIFVDDGSGDGSLQELLELRAAHPDTVTVIKLSRNFGQVAAIYAGFDHARGRCVINISADGQDPPSIINRMLEEHFEGRHEIVVFTREGRDESAYRVWTSRVFYSLMRRLSFPNLPAGGFDCVLLGRKALQILLANREVHPFYQGQILWLGFEPRILGYRRLQRQVGTSRWTFARKVTYLIDGVVSYSHLPIRLISLAGIVVALLGFLYAALIFVLRLVYGNPIQGWAPLMIVILVMGGLQMLMLGAIGEYVWRTLAQARGRDAYVIDEVHDGSE